ncbi:MAG: hypothetical protein K2W96_10030, partial [Gemmataceae bacterium]|nr:hypothetical protein [Gemmataceae bacterium]
MILIRNEPILPADELRGPGPAQGLFRSGFMVVQVSLQPVALATAPTGGWFPAILDSGNSGTFAISRNHFQVWVAPSLAGFTQVPGVTICGATAAATPPVPRYEGALWL